MSTKKSILLLGDCIATGQNCLMPEITQERVFPDFAIDPRYKKKIILWYLNKDSHSKKNVDSLLKDALALKRKMEKEIAWPGILGQDIINLAVSGETFQGMHFKLKQYLRDHTKPNLVLITDFSTQHNCVVVNAGKKYIVKRDNSFLTQEQDIYPQHVYDIFKEKAIKQRQKGSQYQIRKNKKSFYQLEKFLTTNSIDYVLLCFRRFNLENIWNDKEVLDCTHLIDLYRQGDNDDCDKKKKAQLSIANYIKDKLSL